MVIISGFISVVLLIVVLGILIFAHELGHFLTAKWAGVKVHEFALGMGPALFKKQHGETLYALRAFPIGGYCKMEGEDEDSTDERAFGKKPIWKRFIILFAGGFMNILLGFLIMVILMSFSAGFYTHTINTVNEKQPLLKPNDVILEINHDAVYSNMDISFLLSRVKSDNIQLKVKRDGKTVEIKELKMLSEDGRKIIGITTKVEGKNVLTVLKNAVTQTISISRIIWVSLIDLFTGKAGINQMSGPVGTAQALGQAAEQGAMQLIFLVAVITINLGIMNLLPFPALDGGRIFFLLIEAIRRKPIKPEHEGIVHFIGFALLILLMVVVMFNDILRLFK